ncbi:hypothetical protein Bhyg_12014 [Pseudolycoriella hygida]|uniref:Uncharacterized protein n=1 Tax=Pseudolycoriella hygida TaxID=35572 RepID=A0A9Q0S0G6_9DIPT|nr:hypothetical protein Bhyg_12014 [Pseudolycoriella hygida]
MKLRIIELNYRASRKLRWFVSAPMCVGRVNGIQILSKMKAFDIESEYLADCWQALKVGTFPPDFKSQTNLHARCKAPQPLASSHLTIDRHQIIHRNHETDATSLASEDIMTPPCNVLLADIGASTVRNSVVSENTTAKSALCVCSGGATAAIKHDGTNFDAIRLEVIKMRKDILVFQNAMTAKNDTFQRELTTIKSRLATDTDSNQQCRNQDLVNKLSAAERMNVELTITNGKIQHDLNAANSHLTNMESKLSTAERMNLELTDINQKLQHDLNAAQNNFVELETNLQCRIQDLTHKLCEAERKNDELTNTNCKLQHDLNAANSHFINMDSNLQCRIHNLAQKLSTAESMNIELTNTNDKLQDDLYAAKIDLNKNEKLVELEARSVNLMTKFQTQVEELEKLNGHLASENEKLRKEQNAGRDEEPTTHPQNFCIQSGYLLCGKVYSDDSNVIYDVEPLVSTRDELASAKISTLNLNNYSENYEESSEGKSQTSCQAYEEEASIQQLSTAVVENAAEVIVDEHCETMIEVVAEAIVGCGKNSLFIPNCVDAERHQQAPVESLPTAIVHSMVYDQHEPMVEATMKAGAEHGPSMRTIEEFSEFFSVDDLPVYNFPTIVLIPKNIWKQPIAGELEPIYGELQPIYGELEPVSGRLEPIARQLDGQKEPISDCLNRVADRLETQLESIACQLDTVGFGLKSIPGGLEPDTGGLQSVAAALEPVACGLDPVAGCLDPVVGGSEQVDGGLESVAGGSELVAGRLESVAGG